jgi:hypothetical protein
MVTGESVVVALTTTMVMVRDGRDECLTIPMPSTKPPPPEKDELYCNPNQVSIEYHAQKLADYSPQHVLRGALPPALLYQILERNQVMGYVERATCFQVSKLVAYSVYHNRHAVTRPLLWKLTDERKCPFLSPCFEAPVLLLINSQLAASSSSSDPRRGELSNLQERCIASITTYWRACYQGMGSTAPIIETTSRKSAGGNPDLSMLEFLHQLPKLVLLALLSKTCNKADDNRHNHEDVHSLASRLFGVVHSKLLLEDPDVWSTIRSSDDDESCTVITIIIGEDEEDNPLFLDSFDLENFYLEEAKSPVPEYIFCPTIL